MRPLVLFQHTSLDGFVAGPNGEMDWIHTDEEVFDYGAVRIRQADTALYGRKTFEMMEGYWPTAAAQPNATKHDIEHAQWYAQVTKVVLSKTLPSPNPAQAQVISGDLRTHILALKQRPGQEIIMFGSPTAAHALMAESLIDAYWLFVNPILLGQGVPVFKGVQDKTALTLVTNHVFASGVVCLHYQVPHVNPTP